jgi:hypothetical protein
MFKRNSQSRWALRGHNSQSLIDSERLIANAQAGIKRQTRECDLANDKAVVIVGHSGPSSPTLAEFDGQPHDRRRLVSDCDQARSSTLDDASHIGSSPSEETAVRLADKNTVVPDQCAKRALGSRMRHNRQR